MSAVVKAVGAETTDKRLPTGPARRDGPWHLGLQQETNNTHQKEIFNEQPGSKRERHMIGREATAAVPVILMQG